MIVNGEVKKIYAYRVLMWKSEGMRRLERKKHRGENNTIQCILKKWAKTVRTGLIWLIIGASGRLSQTW